MFKKLCKGKVTDEKLIATKAQYRTYWFYVPAAADAAAPRMMSGSEFVWEYRTASLLYADSGEDYLQHIAQGQFAATSMTHSLLLSLSLSLVGETHALSCLCSISVAPLPEFKEIDGATKEQRHRMRVLYEIVATERDYVNDISVLTEVCQSGCSLQQHI
jgi:hypothetical protein